MADPLRLITSRDEHVVSAKETLTKAIEEEYESVLVLGFKNGRVRMHYSKCADVTKFIGAIEVMKHDFMASWK